MFLREGQTGGIFVFVVPKGESLDRDKHFKAWFMSLGKSCEC